MKTETMHLKLSELDKDIVVVSDTAEQWADVNNILKLNGGIIYGVSDFGDTFNSHPFTEIMATDKIWYINTDGSCASDIIVSALDFIAQNTPA